MVTHRVYELMTEDVVTLAMDARLSEAIKKLVDFNISSLVVVDGRRPAGIITERDITRIAGTLSDITGNAELVAASTVMSDNPLTVYKNTDVITALEIMDRNLIRRLIVTERDGTLKGIITYSDILKKLEEEFFKVHATIDTVTTKAVMRIDPAMSLKFAIERMTAEKKSCMLVSSGETITGILTERDIVRLLRKKTSLSTAVVNVCTRDVIYAGHNTLLYEAIRIMHERRIRHLIVVDERFHLKGLVTQSDIINLLRNNITKGINGQFHMFKESLDMLQTGFVDFELNEEGTILWMNKFGAQELGFDSIDRAVGTSFAQLLKNSSQWVEFLKEARSRTAVSSFVFNMSIPLHAAPVGGERKREKVFDCSFRIGKFAANGIFKDVTERFVESEAIRSERNRFGNILKTLSEGILILDRDGVVKEVNDTVLSMFNITRDEIIGKPYHSSSLAFVDEAGAFLSKDDRYILNVLKTARPARNIIRGFKRGDGTIVWFAASITPVLNSENKIEEIVNVMTDITEVYNLKKRNQKILETAKEGYWEVGLDGTILKVNRSLSDVLGYREDELIGTSIYTIFDHDNRALVMQALERRGQGVSESYEIALKHKNGSDIYAMVSSSPLTDSTGEIVGSFAFITDISDLKCTHNILHLIASFSRDLTHALSEKEAYEILKHYLLSVRKGESRINAIYLVNILSGEHKTGDSISYNDSGLPETGVFPGIAKCKSYIYSGTFVVNDLSREYPCPFQRLGAKSGSYLCTAINIGGSIAGILHLYSSSPNFFNEQIEETINSFIALFAPVVNNMRLLELNKKMALIDPLTGLYNRRYLEAFMDKQLALAERNSSLLSIIMIDIDNFKAFNDNNGHEAGDAALRRVSRIINKNIRASDIGVRYGGEEFIIVLPGADKISALEVADRIRGAVETAPVTVSSDRRLFITASLGIATYGIDAGSLEALISRADSALYNAKNTGKNKICLA